MTNPITYQDRVIRPPLFSFLWHFAVACFIGTMLTDITYWRTAEMMWADFSAWLLMAGLVVGAIAALVCLIEYFMHRLVGINRLSTIYVLGNGLALIIEIFNAMIHSRDAWTSVVPMGLVLSAAALIVLILGSLFGRTTVYRRDLGVAE